MSYKSKGSVFLITVLVKLHIHWLWKRTSPWLRSDETDSLVTVSLWKRYMSVTWMPLLLIHRCILEQADGWYPKSRRSQFWGAVPFFVSWYLIHGNVLVPLVLWSCWNPCLWIPWQTVFWWMKRPVPTLKRLSGSAFQSTIKYIQVGSLTSSSFSFHGRHQTGNQIIAEYSRLRWLYGLV
jgi:hypothetical protein